MAKNNDAKIIEINPQSMRYRRGIVEIFVPKKTMMAMIQRLQRFKKEA